MCATRNSSQRENNISSESESAETAAELDVLEPLVAKAVHILYQYHNITGQRALRFANTCAIPSL